MEKGLIAQFHFQEHDLNFWIQLDLYLTMFSFYKPLNNNNKNNYAADNNFLGLDFNNKQVETFKATFGEKCLSKWIFIWF